jgi:hypothetical protein
MLFTSIAGAVIDERPTDGLISETDDGDTSESSC